jgi:hypothetical protein
MEYTNSAEGDAFPSEVQVNLHVLGTLMQDGVGGEVDRTNIVAVDEAGSLERMVKFLKALAEPGHFGNTVRNGTIVSFSTGPGDGCLELGGPRDKTATEEDSVAKGGAASIGAGSPIRISVDDEPIWRSLGKDKTKVEGSLKVSKNPFSSNKVIFPGNHACAGKICWTT